MQFKQLTASLVPEVISLLACTCPVARYINHVIQWCIEFPTHYAVHPKRFFLPFSLVFLLRCSPSLLAVFVSFFGGFSSGFFCLNIKRAIHSTVSWLRWNRKVTLCPLVNLPPQILQFPPHHHFCHPHRFPSQLRHFHKAIS